MGALSVGDVRTGTIPSLLPSQKHYLKVCNTGSLVTVWRSENVTNPAGHVLLGFVTSTQPTKTAQLREHNSMIVDRRLG
ncbi:MAG: hypothetical protein V1736_09215 [Pseudomonadota bacterium]